MQLQNVSMIRKMLDLNVEKRSFGLNFSIFLTCLRCKCFTVVVFVLLAAAGMR